MSQNGTGRLAGKTAFLTASGQGIGRATALAFAREGAQVIATDLDTGLLEALKRESPQVHTERLDVRDRGAVAKLGERGEPIDILFNCAGFVHHGTVLDCDDAEWERSFDLNVGSMHRVVRALLPGMLARGAGSIVNVASVVSSVAGRPNRYVYGASKGAVIGLTKAIAADFIARGIRVNAICPGTIETPSLGQRISSQGNPEKTRSNFQARQPIGRFGTPEEVASVAVYLASDEAAFTTGQIVIVDGGMTL